MRQETINIYPFEELSEEAQQKALAWWLKGGLDYEWWENVYENAENVGIKITAYGERHIEGYCLTDIKTVITNILKDHDKDTPTHITASNLKIEQLNILEKRGEWGTVKELEHDFLYDILEDYRTMLNKEYEYLTSEESAKESIISNEYEFTVKGSVY